MSVKQGDNEAKLPCKWYSKAERCRPLCFFSGSSDIGSNEPKDTALSFKLPFYFSAADAADNTDFFLDLSASSVSSAAEK